MSSPGSVTGLEVSVFGTDAAGKPFTQPARAVRMDGAEVTVEGIERPLHVNNLVGLSHGNEEGLFRVIWVGAQGTPQQGQVGLREMHPDKRVLGSMTTTLALGSITGKTTTVVFDFGRTPRHNERRRHPRISCRGSVTFRYQDTAVSGELKLLSLGGCYIETPAVLTPAAPLGLSLKVEDLELEIPGRVQALHPGFGVGVAFRDIDPSALARLEQWLSRHCQR